MSPMVTSPGRAASATVEAPTTDVLATDVLATDVQATDVQATDVQATNVQAIDVATTVAGPPPGIVSASPFQYRLDWAAGIFQVRVRNDSPDPLTIIGVQFVWQGLTTPVTERHDTLPSGLALDFPVHIAQAVCIGDGLAGTMPSLSTAVVQLDLDDGSAIDAPVFDIDGVAQQLYLDDCERQMIDSQVTIEWAGLRDEELDGRVVTGGGLRLGRGDSTSDVTLLSVSNTVLFTVQSIDTAPDEPLGTLAADQDELIISIRITENRCDAHARSESSQSFRFVAQVDLGDGRPHPYLVLPTNDEQVEIRARLEAGCAHLEDTGFVGQADD